MNKGKLIISLDFELHWGATEKGTLNLKKEYFDNTRLGIPKILALFEKFNIHASWATVGFLFAKNKKQLIDFCPSILPTYSNKKLLNYNLIHRNQIGWDEHDDPYHYAYSLISKIINTPNQELATHTFSHYYCNELGQEKNQFNADLEAAQNLSIENFDIKLRSIVFPRNQINFDYLSIACQNGINVVRSNPNVWFWKRKSNLTPLIRAVDTLFPISKSLSFDMTDLDVDDVLLLPASRFLRPYSDKEKLIQKIKFHRIKQEMLYAARNNKVYHLWWHPHNFGKSLHKNLYYLESILKNYKKLEMEYGFESINMIEMYQMISKDKFAKVLQ